MSILKIIYLESEATTAISCLAASQERIAESKNPFQFDAPMIFLLSIGLERYFKIAQHVLTYATQGAYSKKIEANHNILNHEKVVLSLHQSPRTIDQMSLDDADFRDNDPALRELLGFLTQFANFGARYYALDFVAGKSGDPANDPEQRWRKVLEALDVPSITGGLEDIHRMIKGYLLRYVRRFLRYHSRWILRSLGQSTTTAANGMFLEYALIKDVELERH